MAVFINYRRSDSLGITGRIYEHLQRALKSEEIFLDMNAILPGTPYLEYIQFSVDKCDVFLVIIGEKWLNDRLADEADILRLEIEAALRRKIPIIPVTVDGGKLPTADSIPSSIRRLVEYQTIGIDSGRLFPAQMGQLIDAIYRLTGRRPPEVSFLAKLKTPRLRLPFIFVLLVAGGIGFYYLASPTKRDETIDMDTGRRALVEAGSREADPERSSKPSDENPLEKVAVNLDAQDTPMSTQVNTPGITGESVDKGKHVENTPVGTSPDKRKSKPGKPQTTPPIPSIDTNPAGDHDTASPKEPSTTPGGTPEPKPVKETEYGSLFVRAQAPMEVYLEGKKRGMSGAKLTVPAGSYQFYGRRTGSLENLCVKDSVEIKSGETKNIICTGGR